MKSGVDTMLLLLLDDLLIMKNDKMMINIRLSKKNKYRDHYGPHYYAGAEAQWLCMCAPRHHYAVSLSLDAINLSSFLLSNLLLVQSVSAYHFSSVKQVNTILLIVDEKQNSKHLKQRTNMPFTDRNILVNFLPWYRVFTSKLNF